MLTKLDPNSVYAAKAYVIQNEKRIDSDTYFRFTTEAVTITSSTITMSTAKAGEVWFALTGTGATTVNWGDGSPPETVVIMGQSNHTFNHRYTSSTSRTITISGNNITFFSCFNNQLTNLIFNGCTALEQIYCFNNHLTSLNFNGCTALRFIDCNNNYLTYLNVNSCAKLERLVCYTNQLSNLNLNGCLALTWLQCFDNKISGVIPVFSKLEVFQVDFRYIYNEGKITDRGYGWWYHGEPWNYLVEYTACSVGSWNCNNHTFYYGQIKSKIIAVRDYYHGSIDSIEFRIQKCDDSPFQHSGIAYVNVGQTCTTAIASSSYKAGDYYVDIVAPVQRGTRDYYLTVASVIGEYYSTNKITVSF